MRVSPVLVLLAACVPTGSSQQQPAQPWGVMGPTSPSAYSQPVAAQPTYDQPAGQPAAAASGGSCAEVFACYTRCETVDAACVSACESGANPYAAGAARQLAVCTIEHQCTDDKCQATNCGTEIQTCVMGGAGTQPQVATTTPAPTRAAPPAAASGGSRGQVYVGISLTAGGLDYYGTHNIEFRVLYDDGTIARMMPPNGLDGVDTASLHAIYTDMIGTYAVDGDEIKAQYQTSYGTYPETFHVKRDGMIEGVKNVQGTFMPTDTLDGATLEGNYACGTATWGFQFTADGRFHADRDAMMVLRDRQGNVLDSLPEGSGSYRIAANTLTLAYDSGQIVYIAIATLVDRDQFPRPQQLFINTFSYHPA